MLGLGGSLRFPRLVWVQAVDIHTNSENIPCYTLDWNPLNEISCPYFVPLPVKYIAQSEGAWAIRGNYGQAITHYAQLALIEAAKVSTFGLDTMMREVSHKVAEQAVFTTFRLLADCDYDPQTQYWSRSPERLILPYLLAWRFWQKQTGRGNLWEKARIPELIRKRDISNFSKKEVVLIDEFLDVLRNTEKAMDQCMEQPPEEGPSLGDALHVVDDLVSEATLLSPEGLMARVKVIPMSELTIWHRQDQVREVRPQENFIYVPLINPGKRPNAFPTKGSWFRVSCPKYPGLFGFFQFKPSGTVPTKPADDLQGTEGSSGDAGTDPRVRG